MLWSLLASSGEWMTPSRETSVFFRNLAVQIDKPLYLTLSAHKIKFASTQTQTHTQTQTIWTFKSQSGGRSRLDATFGKENMRHAWVPVPRVFRYVWEEFVGRKCGDVMWWVHSSIPFNCLKLCWSLMFDCFVDGPVRFRPYTIFFTHSRYVNESISTQQGTIE